MLQGTVSPAGWLREFPVGAVKLVTPPDDIDAAELLARFDSADGDALAELARGSAAAGDARSGPRDGH